MFEKLKQLFLKYEEIIVYLIVGGITTVVSWTCMFFVNIVIFGNPLYPTVTQNLVLSAVSWVSGVAAAYPMNRKFVFKSKEANIMQELGKFIMARISTLILELVSRQILGAIGVDVFITTLIVAVLVTVGNYIFSKLMLFRKK